jgi:hypothetical protein
VTVTCAPGALTAAATALSTADTIAGDVACHAVPPASDSFAVTTLGGGADTGESVAVKDGVSEADAVAVGVMATVKELEAVCDGVSARLFSGGAVAVPV